MAFQKETMLRDGSTNFTTTETNPTSLFINGTPRNGIWGVIAHSGSSGTSQTCSVQFQVSDDNATWVNYGSAITVQTAAGRIASPLKIQTARKYISYVATIGGTGTPTFNKLQIALTNELEGA